MNVVELFERGVALHRAGDLAQAERCYSELLALDASHDRALYLVATIELGRGEAAAAIAHLEHALRVAPENVAVLANLGEAYRRSGREADAVRVFRRALELKPDFAEVHYNLGLTLERLDQLSAAQAAFQRAVGQKPALRPAHVALGRVLWTIGQIDQAFAHYTRSLELFPDDAELHQGIAACLKDMARLDESLEHTRRALAQAPDDHAIRSGLVYALSFHPGYSDAQILAQAREWEARHALHPATQSHDNDRDPQRRLRIGYIGPTFSDHIIGRLLEPVFEQHEREQYEIHCYSDTAYPDARTGQLRRLSNHFSTTHGIADHEVAQRIQRDRIDVLVDVNMHMASSRLRVFTLRPAPVQMCWIAYTGTTGLSTMDYRISDPYLDPPGTDHLYSERTLRLPDCFWCYPPPSSEPVELAPPPALASGQVTFGCLNNPCKLNRAVLEAWAAVLSELPASRLLVLAHAQGARDFIASTLRDRGVDPARLEFVGFQRRADYLATYQRIDIGLDTFPYNGHTTSLDAFWMGVPVITLAGDTLAGRAGTCLASNLALPQLIGRTREDFVRIAVELGRDAPRLRELRAGLRARMEASPLMDAARFTRGLEALYRRAWAEWCGR